jgi:hypothetical protein
MLDAVTVGVYLVKVTPPKNQSNTIVQFPAVVSLTNPTDVQYATLASRCGQNSC